MSNNSTALLFFKEVEKLFRVNDNGGLDVDYHLLSLDTNSPAVRWILGKIPESFLRGVTSFEKFYGILLPKPEGVTYDKALLSKLAAGNFKDIEDIELISSQIIKLLQDKNVIEQTLKLGDRLLGNDVIISYQGVRTFYDIIELYIKKTVFGHFSFDKYDDMKKYLHIKEYTVYKDSIKKDMKERLKSWKDSDANNEERLRQMTQELDDVNRKIRSYNFITSLIYRKEKVQCEKRKQELEGQIEFKKQSADRLKESIEELEEEINLAEKYEVIVSEVVHGFTLIFINAIRNSDNISQSEKERLQRIVERLSSDENLKLFRGEFLGIVEEVSHAIDIFNNALTTIAYFPQMFIVYEEHADEIPLVGKSESEPSLLKMIRTQISKVQTDENHKKIVIDSYRDFSLGKGNTFFAHAASPDEIEAKMLELNEEYKELLKIENIDEYIKKAGMIWYKFMLIHPYNDGNGRTGRYLLNIMLAHRNIIIPSFYGSLKESTDFANSLDIELLFQLESAYDRIGDTLLRVIKKCWIDFSNSKRIVDNQDVSQEKLEIDDSDIEIRRKK